MNKLTLAKFDTEKEFLSNTELLFGGDFCPIGRYEEKMLSGEDIFHDELKSLLKNTFSMINLEAPLCEKNIPADNLDGFGLRGNPEIADYLKNLGIDIAGFANNHTRDFKSEGIRQTLQNLERAKIVHIGAGENLKKAEEILELNINGLKVGIWTLAEKELNIASKNKGGSSWFNPERNLPLLQKISGNFDFFIVYLHAGHEFISTPSPRIRNACRAFIDAGADAVIAHHPHVIQGVEKYKGGLIAYSLGNLVFDSPYVSAYKETDLGYMVKLNISKHSINKVEIIPYKLRKDIIVSPLENNEFDKFTQKFHEISENIIDDSKFYSEWEKNVKFRWETEYRNVLNNFSKNMNDPENLDYARRSRNLLSSPTHTEMIEKIFLMLEEGKLKRNSK